MFARLEEVAVQSGGIAQPGLESTRAKLERICLALPKRLSFLLDRAQRLTDLAGALEREASWVETCTCPPG